MKIEILGTGCAKCDLLARTVKATADRLGVACEIVHVKEINAILSRGVMLTPALAVNGKVRVSGKVPSETEITRILSEAAGDAGQAPRN